MTTNSFKENTLGYSALQALEKANEAQKALGMNFVLQKSDEVKKIISAESATGAQLTTGAATKDVRNKAMTVDEAIRAYSNVESTSLAGQTVVDAVIAVAPSGEQTLFEVAPMKAVGSKVSTVTEGVLDSTHIVCQASKQNTNNEASIRDRTKRENLPNFAKAIPYEGLKDAEIVAKSVEMTDFDVAATLFWANLLDFDTLNLLVESARRTCEAASQGAIRDYAAHNTVDENTLLMMLRLQNRSLADSIFKECYEARYSETTISSQPTKEEIENFNRYVNLIKRFHAGLYTIGNGRNISPTTVQIGIKRLKVVTSKKQNVISVKKVNKVKTNAVNSYFRMTPEDTGLFTAVCTEDSQTRLMTDYAPKFIKVAMRWLLNEQLHFLEMDDLIKGKDKDESYLADIANLTVPKVEQHTTAELLGLSSIEASTKTALISKFYALANKTIADYGDDRAISAIEAASRIISEED